MNRSKAHSQQNMQKCRNRITRYKSLEASDMLSGMKGRDYGSNSKMVDPVCKNEMQFISTNSGSCIVNEALEHSSRNLSGSSRSSGPPGYFDYSQERKNFSSFRGIREIVPSQFLMSGTEFQSSEDETNILAMPLEVTRDPKADRDIEHLVYGEKRGQQMCVVDKNARKPTQIKDKEERGAKLRRMIPDGSYIISKENYIISKQTRLPKEIVEEKHLGAEILTSSIAAGSVSEVVDNSKFINVATRCTLVLLLALTCVGWYLYVFKTSPILGAPPQKTSLLRGKGPLTIASSMDDINRGQETFRGSITNSGIGSSDAPSHIFGC